MNFIKNLKNAWGVFRNRNPSYTPMNAELGAGSYYRSDKNQHTSNKQRSIINSVFNRIAVDASSLEIRHCQLDTKTGMFKHTIRSSLDDCLNYSANIDQPGLMLRRDMVESLLDWGTIAITPTYCKNPHDVSADSIAQLRVGRIVEWYPQHVKVELYDDQTGKRQQVVIPKNETAIVENPFYSMMNSSNSMMARLTNKLNLLDAIDEKNNSGRLDLIIRLPYAIRGDLAVEKAKRRQKELEEQLSGSKYGVAYIDATENVTQLNRPVENNLLSQIEYLTTTIFTQIGFNTAILDGSASEDIMANYYTRIVEPIVAEIVASMTRSFITKTARTQGQTLMFFRDPLKLIPPTKFAEIGDKMKRNEILSSNELRAVIGRAPSDDPKANKLENSNIRQPDENQNGSPNAVNQVNKKEDHDDGSKS